MRNCDNRCMIYLKISLSIVLVTLKTAFSRQDINTKNKEDDKSMKSPPSKRKSLSPTWGKSKRDTKTPSSSDQCSKGDSSTSHSNADNGWGNINLKFKDRRRTSPRATTGEIIGKDHPQTQGTQVTATRHEKDQFPQQEIIYLLKE
jgi:hypothetical protein